MFDRPVRNVMQRRNLLKASPHISVAQAARLMARKNVGAIMVVDDARLIGIFTERDVVFERTSRVAVPVRDAVKHRQDTFSRI